MIKITTRISRDEMEIATLADPRRKRVHWRHKKKGRDMVESVIYRMDNLVKALVSRSYYRFAHYTDRANSIEDMIATIKGELVLAIYRYHSDGKYEPYNYLMGVANVVLKNIHNRRNRKKRIPFNKMLSIDTPVSHPQNVTRFGDGDASLSQLIGIDKDRTREDEALVTRLDVESIFSVLRDRFARIDFHDHRGANRRRRISYNEVIAMILDGYSVSAIARIYRVPRHVMRRLIRERIVRIINRDGDSY